MTDAPPTVPALRLSLLNRERSILEFNRRVLAQALRADVPLLERLRYVTIVSSNLDEFFEVRFAGALEAARAPGAGEAWRELIGISGEAHALIDEQYAVFNEQVMPSLALHGIRVVNHAERSESQRRWVARFFEREVLSLLCAGGTRPGASVPAGGQQVAELHRATGRRNAFGRENTIAIVELLRGQAARDQAVRTTACPKGEQHPRAAVQRDPWSPGRTLSRPRRRVVLAVPCRARLRARSGRGRHPQPAPSACAAA